jgi:hypothetical protein
LLNAAEWEIVVEMQAFMDESGTHKGAPIISVGAWVGAQWQWKKFLSHWGERHFHAKESKCAPLKHGLFEAIQFSGIQGFTAWLQPEDYTAHATPHFKSGLGNPYAVCTFACVMGIGRHCRTNNLGRVAFFIENGQPNVNFVKQTLEYMKTRERSGVASVAVVQKKDFVQLCTADFLAHSRSSDKPWFDTLYNTGNVFQDHITPQKIARMSRQITDGFRRIKNKRSES